MWHRSVDDWLKGLRYTCEYYYDCFPPRGESGPMSSRGSYENLWECSERPPETRINYGKVSRISVVYDDSVQPLTLAPPIYERLDPDDLTQDVVMWKRWLKYSCCEEEENFFENEDLITDFDNGPKDNPSKPANFPVDDDEEVQRRPSKGTSRLPRPQTCSPTSTIVKNERAFSPATRAQPSRNQGTWFQLKRLLKKRASRDVLEMKGIIKNEAIFGNTLEELCSEKHPVPEVVTRLAALIELEENITSLGLYRTSANLAVVQNIRCQIDCGKWDVLDKHRKDVDVLAGALKLFFRELKHPLITPDVFQALKGSPAAGKDIPKILKRLPRQNQDTLHYLIGHLLKVYEHEAENKMNLHNIAIVWGPTLTTFPESCTDLVTETAEVARVAEDLLTFYNYHKPDERPTPNTDDFQVVRRLTEVIEQRIDTEGIYKKSGSKKGIDRIMEQLEKRNIDELDFSKDDTHDLCCVLKKFVTSKRESVIPGEFFQWYCSICDSLNDAEVRDQVVRKIAELPRRKTVYFLFKHLNKVVEHERHNKMALSKLSDIWMTTLLGPDTRSSYKNKLFRIFMDLEENLLPDLVPDPKTRTESKYDNVPDDILNDDETSDDKISTKL